MNDTVIKTEKLQELKKKAEKWDKLIKAMPDKIFPSDYSNLGHKAVKIHLEND
jgi:hypothetical protein